MKYRLMDLLACPYDKEFPLRLIVFEEEYHPERVIKVEKTPFCELYCALRDKKVENLAEGEVDCEECVKREIKNGILICPKCGRWYPIIEYIPELLPDELREKERELKFLEKWRSKVPSEVLEKGLPWNLSQG